MYFILQICLIVLLVLEHNFLNYLIYWPVIIMPQLASFWLLNMAQWDAIFCSPTYKFINLVYLRLHSINTPFCETDHLKSSARHIQLFKVCSVSNIFVGLSHCRHLKTVRTHLSGLVNSTVISVEVPHDASQGLTVERWAEMSASGVVSSNKEIYRLVYYGTCSHEIRKEVKYYLHNIK